MHLLQAKTAPSAPPTAGPSTPRVVDSQKKRKNDSADDTRKTKKSKSKTVPSEDASAIPTKVKKTSKKRAASPSDSDANSDDNAGVEDGDIAEL